VMGELIENGAATFFVEHGSIAAGALSCIRRCLQLDFFL
jgi:hypothetical protein